MLRRWPWLLALPCVVPLLALVVAVAGPRWFPTGDFSHTELLLRSIPDHPPLIGVAARVDSPAGQGTTPGPAMAYVLWPVYALAGSTSWSMLLSVNTLHAASIVAAVVLAARIGGPAAGASTAGVLVVLVRALAPGFFVEPWNVWLPVFAFVVLLVLVWGMALGRVAMLPWAVAVGVFCVQTHVSYVVTVSGLLGASLLRLAWLTWRSHAVAVRALLTSTAVAAVVFVLAWVPPVVEELRPGYGNLRKLYEEFGSPDQPTVGLRAAVKAMAGEFNLQGPWITGEHRLPTEDPNLLGFVGFVALVASAVWVAWRRRDRDVLALQAVLGLATVLGLVSTTRIFGGFFEYVIRWMWPLVATIVMSCTWAWWRALRAAARRAPAMRGVLSAPVPVAAVGLVVVLVTTAWATARGADAQVPYPLDSALVGGLADAVDDHLDPQLHYRVERHDPVILGAGAYGLVLELERRGFDGVGIAEWGSAGAMPWRVVDRAEADGGALWVVTGQVSIDAFRGRGDSVELGYFDPRSDADQVRSAEVREQIEDGLCAAGRGELIPVLDEQYGLTSLALFADRAFPPELVPLLAEYTDLRLPGAVFLLPADSDGAIGPIPAPC